MSTNQRPQHSPTPWRLEYQPSHLYGNFINIRDAQGALVHFGDASNPRQVANAELVVSVANKLADSPPDVPGDPEGERVEQDVYRSACEAANHMGQT